MQRLGQGLGAVVFHRTEQGAFEVLGMPGLLQIRVNQPLRRHMQRQVAHFVALAFHSDMGHAFALVDAAHGQRAQLLAA